VPIYETNYISDNSKREVAVEKIKEEVNKPFLKKKDNTATSHTAPNFVPVQGINNPFNLEMPNYFVPVVKNISVNMSNPLTAHPFEIVNNIYEDYIIPSLVNNKNATISSRQNIYNIIRNVILNKMDGREIHMATKNESSLLSYLKIIEANPYHYIKDTTNPYQTNPFNMVVIRSGYPIRYNHNGVAVDLGRENINLNMRVYRLNNGEYFYPRFKFLNELKLNPWRELLYYYYVSKNIVNAFASPHFVIPYGYFMFKTRINFETLNRLRNDPTRQKEFETYTKNKYGSILNSINPPTTSIPRVVGEFDGGGVALITSTTILLIFRNNKLREFSGMLYDTNLENSILSNALRKSENKIPIKADMLTHYQTFNTTPGRKAKIYFIKTEVLPADVTDSYVFDFVNDDETRLSVELHPITKEVVAFLKTNRSFIDRLKLTNFNPILVPREIPNKVPRQVDEAFLSADSKISLLLLTESPTHSFYQWCSRKYDSNFSSVKRMERLGIYTDDVWENVLFQVLQGLYTMQKFKVFIRELSFRDNVYIKDIQQLSNQVWLYSIDGVDYYVPNEGYLVLYDIGGKEIKEDTNFPSKVSLGEWNENNIDVFENFVKMFNPNNFSSEALSFLTNLPSDKIITRITNIYTEAIKTDAPKNISHYIETFFTQFRHPRIGTLLTETEYAYLSFIDKTFTKGELVAYVNLRSDEPVWAVYLGGSEVLTYDVQNNVGQRIKVNKYNNLMKYVSKKPIEQSFNKLIDISPNNILERYKI